MKGIVIAALHAYQALLSPILPLTNAAFILLVRSMQSKPLKNGA